MKLILGIVGFPYNEKISFYQLIAASFSIEKCIHQTRETKEATYLVPSEFQAKREVLDKEMGFRLIEENPYRMFWIGII